MKFKELLPSAKMQHYKKPASTIGASKFGTDIFQKDTRTPHWEMREIINIIETRPHVYSGLKQIVRFIVGSEITVDTEDAKTKEYMDNWIKKRKGFYKKVSDLIFLAIGVGNSYLEPIYKRQGEKLVFDNFDIIPDPSRMYINMNEYVNDDENYWIYSIPLEVRSLGEERPQFFKINYIRGGLLWRENVYGLPYSKKHFDHLSIGWSRDGVYGRGYLASTIDDNNILKEILKNIAVIARYRALNTKLITPASEDSELIEDDVEYIEQRLLDKRDEEHLVLNKALKVDSLSNTNEYDTMSSEIDYLRRDISSGLVPNFITPWDSDVNRATAGESKIPFELELQSIEKEIINFLNTSILERLKSNGAPIADDATFKFGQVNMESYDSRIQITLQLYGQGVISFNEARKMAELEAVKGGDKFAWEIQQATGDTLFSQTKRDTKPAKMTAKLNEQFFHTQSQKTPRTRICSNCKNYAPKKRFCKLNNWPVEGGDGCARFEKKDDEQAE